MKSIRPEDKQAILAMLKAANELIEDGDLVDAGKLMLAAIRKTREASGMNP